MVDTRKAEGQGWNLMVSRDRMVLYLEHAAMAELGVRCDISRRDHYSGWYARVEKHLNHLLGWVPSGPRGQFSIDSVVCGAPTGGNRQIVAHPKWTAEQPP